MITTTETRSPVAERPNHTGQVPSPPVRNDTRSLPVVSSAACRWPSPSEPHASPPCSEQERLTLPDRVSQAAASATAPAAPSVPNP